MNMYEQCGSVIIALGVLVIPLFALVGLNDYSSIGIDK